MKLAATAEQSTFDELHTAEPFTSASQLSRLDARFQFRERHDLAGLVNWSAGKSAAFHRWFRYREAYSPDLVEALGLGARILDPFCGCGSALIGSMQSGRSATGIDLNPLAAFVTKVKIAHLEQGEIELIEAFARNIPQHEKASVEAKLPDLSIAQKVFEPTILRTVLDLKAQISSVGLSKNARDFLHLAWLGILETVGSYYKEGNGIKYRKMMRRPGRYVEREHGSWQAKRFGEDQRAFVLTTFRQHLCDMLEDTRAWKTMPGTAEVVLGNALDLDTLAPGHFDDIVFSPPYANRFDYFESMKVELWFGDFVENYGELQTLRKQSLRSHLGADLTRPTVCFDELEDIISRMDTAASSWRMGVPDLLRGYFSDITHVLQKCRKKIKDGACYVVVGNSAFAGTIIPSDTLTAIAGRKAGFTNAEIWVTRPLTVAPQQRSVLAGLEPYMRESVVVLST
ncbi:SAM-dependent methyltransferase [Sinorhizobium medicae]|nr:SAM-dependent methyltransferase [Sinorhizobium medicae]